MVDHDHPPFAMPGEMTLKALREERERRGVRLLVGREQLRGALASVAWPQQDGERGDLALHSASVRRSAS